MASAPLPARVRVDTIDLVRGVVMVVMMLDHVRDFVHSATFQYDATDLSKASAALFLTRWITHFSAPTFVFLAGAGAYLQRVRGKPAAELSWFLVTRGLWLVVLELTVIRLLAFGGLGLRTEFFLQVIWVIGVGMLCLAALSRLPVRTTGALGIAMIALHDLADGRVPASSWHDVDSPLPSTIEKLGSLLHVQGGFPVADVPGPIVFVLYPLVPWVGVMCAGWAFGTLYTLDAARRRRALVALGLALTALFVLLRAASVYGDPSGWHLHHPRGPVYTALSFLNVQKYPPSLDYLLMTLGPVVAALGLLEQRPAAARGHVARWLTVYGRVPLFFYVLQWMWARGIAIALGFLAGQRLDHLGLDPDFSNLPPNVGFGLGVVYLCWIAGVVLLYPLCRWFAGVKARRTDWWLGYL